jgi:GT2 family glycosyltransferase
MKEQCLISIIIVNWNTRELLIKCLRSIYNHLAYERNYEIIVVDNGSSDGSVEAVKGEFSNVIVIECKTNLGFVEGNNVGVKVAKGKYLLLLNSDTLVLDGGMTDIIGYMEGQPDVGVATGRVLYPDKRFQRPFRRFPHWIGGVFRNTIRLVADVDTPFEKRFRLEHLDEFKMHDVDWVFGAYMFVRKDLLEENKVFDEDLFMWYEDTLLCRKMHSSGYRVVYLPFAPIIHFLGESRRKVPVVSAYNSFKGSVIYFKKVYGEEIAQFYCFTVRSIWVVFVIGFTLLQVLPYQKFKKKVRFFRELINMGPAT